MNETPLPDIEFDLTIKKGRQWRTAGTARLTKTGKGYACTLDKGQKLEGRFFLFPKDQKGEQPPEDEEAAFIKNYQSAGDEYGI